MLKMPVKRQSPQTRRSNGEFIYLQCGKNNDNNNTVQTSWRPQLPLPKELQAADEHEDETVKYANDMERLRHSSSHSKKDNHNPLHSSQLSNASSSSKKWSFGRLFRKKKDNATDSSSEEDRKAGFTPVQKNYLRNGSGSNGSKTKSKSNKGNRSSKLIGAGFDHIVVSPTQAQAAAAAPAVAPLPASHVDHEFFLPVETVPATYKEPYYQNQQQQQRHPQSQQQYLAQSQQQQYSRSSNSLDRRAAHKSRSTQRLPHEQEVVVVGGGGGAHTSSEEELISLNSSTFSKYRSDESIHSGGQAQNGQSRRSRAARNERYYKRLSRDGEVSHGQVPVMYAPQPAQRWKTQPVPLSIYQGPPLQTHVRHASQHVLPPSTSAMHGMRNTTSLQHVAPYVQWGQVQQQPKQLQNAVNDSKRSISYDSHIHLQNASGRLQAKPLPPPPPPRDPLRRVHVSGHMQNASSGDLRPLSYAFDKNGAPVLPAGGLNARCVSDDKIWAAPMPHYQSAHSLNMPTAYQQAQHQQQQQQHSQLQQTQNAPTAHSRRFITRAERDSQLSKKSLPNGIDFHYVADSTPRSRKPIHLLEQQLGSQASNDPPSSGILRTTKSGLPAASPTQNASSFWKRLDEGSQRHGRDVSRADTDAAVAKPRSISSSRVGELRSYPIPMYSEVYKPNRKPQPAPKQSSVDEVDSVVCGSLHIKPSEDNASNYVEIRHKDVNKSNSMPDHYQRRSAEIPTAPNKYDEYVAEKRELHQKPIYPPAPPMRKLSIPSLNAPPISFPRKKPANLEEAINELEAIYKSLGLTEEPEKKERVPTPSEFEKFALAHADEYDDDDDSPTGEPDPVRDDVAYRNIQLANLQHKAAEKQPPFGIPIGPIVPSSQTDYLHVTPAPDKCKIYSAPDVIKDDLAVRALRKDPPGPKEKFVYPTGSMQKKNRATRTQSANIYSLIQRDAAKPSGGDVYSYLELTRSIDRSGSMSDLHKSDTAADIPATLTLLRNLKEQEQQQQQQALVKKAHIPFRHPSQGGAICQLPEKLSTSPNRDDAHRPPVPLPRKSLTPEPLIPNHQMEDALNKIAKDAQESSVKLSKELLELRKGGLITAARAPKVNADEEKLAKDLQEIEAVSEAAKRCGKMLLDTLPDANAQTAPAKPRKLHKEGKLIEAIDQVSEAANAVCEKILKDIVTTEPPVIVHEAVKVKNKPQLEQLVMPNLIKKLDPIQSEKIEAIAQRCMRQLSELAETPDYDNLDNQDAQPAAASVACNTATCELDTAQKVDSILSTLAEIKPTVQKVEIEEIDKIMQECEAKVRAEASNSNSSALIEKPPTGAHLPSVATSGSESKSIMTASSSSSNAGHANTNAPASSTTASSFSSSSDCLAKSSSPSAGRRLSSSITSFNPYSSSDYIKSPSSEYHAPSTDPIKTFSTTSYDQSTSATPNITTNSTFSYSPSPPLNLTPKTGRARTAAAAAAAGGDIGRLSEERARSSSPSQYNSSEELAMIFGIEEKPKQMRRKSQQLQVQPQTHISGKVLASDTHASKLLPFSSSNHALCATADSESQTDSASVQLTNPNAACDFVAPTTNTACLNVVFVNDDDDATATYSTPTNTTTTITTNVNTNSSMNSPTNASPTSCKLETIPEILVEQEQLEQPVDSLKLSPNFNRLYASKISITVDRALSDGALDANSGSLTQFDSLSSLEETSSNPDSGNVSLADFPLTSSANACLQLQTSYNSRYEVRNTFVSEVRIEPEPERGVIESLKEVEELNDNMTEQFPPPPTDEELLDSLKDESELTEICAIPDLGIVKVIEENELNETVTELCVAANLGTMKPNDKDELNENMTKFCAIPNLISRELNDKLKLNETVELELNVDVNFDTMKSNNKFDLDKTETEPRAIPNVCTGDLDDILELNETATELCVDAKLSDRELNDQLKFNEIVTELSVHENVGTVQPNDKYELNENISEVRVISNLHETLPIAFSTVPQTELLDSTDNSSSFNEHYDSLQAQLLDASELNEDTSNDASLVSSGTPARKNSVVYETPQLNMNIIEVKLNYNEPQLDSLTQEAEHDVTTGQVEQMAEAAATPPKEERKVLTQIKQCTAAVEQLNEALNQMPRRRTAHNGDTSADVQRHAEANRELSLLPWHSSSTAAAAASATTHPNDNQEKPTSSAIANAAVSLLGEARPANGLTILEHVLVACSLGVISPNDLYTLCLIVIGMITIIAIVLF